MQNELKKSDKEIVVNLNYKGIKFLVPKKSYHKIETKNCMYCFWI